MGSFLRRFFLVLKSSLLFHHLVACLVRIDLKILSMWIYYHGLVLIIFSHWTDKVIFPVSPSLIQLILLYHKNWRSWIFREYILLLCFLCHMKPILESLTKFLNQFFWINWGCVSRFNPFYIILERLEKTRTLFWVDRFRTIRFMPVTLCTLAKLTKLSQISVILFKGLFAKNVPCFRLDLFHKVGVLLTLVPSNKGLWIFLDIFEHFLVFVFQVNSFQEKLTSFLLIFPKPKTSMRGSKLFHLLRGPFLFVLIFKSNLQKSRYLMQKFILLLFLFRIQTCWLEILFFCLFLVLWLC